MSHLHRKPSAGWVVLQLLLCAVGINVCFTVWSLKQERVATKPYTFGDGSQHPFRFPLVLNLVQNLFSASIGVLLLKFVSKISLWPTKSDAVDGDTNNKKGGDDGQGLIPLLISIGFTQTFASPFGYLAMERLSFPIVLCVKMCKMVPVVVVGSVVHRVRYSAEKYATVFLITAGVLLFTLLEDAAEAEEETSASKAKKRVERASSLMGLVLVAINLGMDGFTNASQDVLSKRYKWCSNRMMCWSNLSAAMWSVAAMALLEVFPVHLGILKPEFSEAMWFFKASNEALWDVAAMGLMNALGQLFIFRTISLFGSLTVTAITLVRKVGSVLLSIVIHDHVVNGKQWGSLVFILVGIILETRISIKEKSRQSPHPAGPAVTPDKRIKAA